MVFWSKARIPTKTEQHVVTKIEKFVDKYQKLKKNKYHKSKTQKQKECDFLKELGSYFDIANQNSQEFIIELIFLGFFMGILYIEIYNQITKLLNTDEKA